MLTIPPVPLHGCAGSTQAQKLSSTPLSVSRKWNPPHTVAPGHTPPPHWESSLVQGVVPSGKHAHEEPLASPRYSLHEKPGSHAPSHAGAPLPPVQGMRGSVVRVVVVVVEVVVVVLTVGIAATAFATRSSTKRSMAAASPVVRHGGRASVFAKASTKRASAFARHVGSTVSPRPI